MLGCTVEEMHLNHYPANDYFMLMSCHIWYKYLMVMVSGGTRFNKTTRLEEILYVGQQTRLKSPVNVRMILTLSQIYKLSLGFI